MELFRQSFQLSEYSWQKQAQTQIRTCDAGDNYPSTGRQLFPYVSLCDHTKVRGQSDPVLTVPQLSPTFSNHVISKKTYFFLPSFPALFPFSRQHMEFGKL